MTSFLLPFLRMIKKNILSTNDFSSNPKPPNDIAKELAGNIKRQGKKLKIS